MNDKGVYRTARATPGLLKTAPDGTEPHTHGHGDSMTESAQWEVDVGTSSPSLVVGLVQIRKSK